MVCEFEPRVGLYADSPEAGVCFVLCLPLSLSLPHSYSVSLSKINKHKIKSFFKKRKTKGGRRERDLGGFRWLIH